MPQQAVVGLREVVRHLKLTEEVLELWAGQMTQEVGVIKVRLDSSNGFLVGDTTPRQLTTRELNQYVEQ